MYSLGLFFVSPFGFYIFQVFDDYSLSFGLLIVYELPRVGLYEMIEEHRHLEK